MEERYTIAALSEHRASGHRKKEHLKEHFLGSPAHAQTAVTSCSCGQIDKLHVACDISVSVLFWEQLGNTVRLEDDYSPKTRSVTLGRPRGSFCCVFDLILKEDKYLLAWLK